MSTSQTQAPLVAALELLERALGYTLLSLHDVSPQDLGRRTPCDGWDLRRLLLHLEDSMRALQDAADVGYVDLRPDEPGAAADVVTSLRAKAGSLLGAWTNNDGADLVSVAGCPVSAAVLVSTGALEIAVHGWDVASACQHRRSLPASLAGHLLSLVPRLVADQDRPGRFATPVTVASAASAGERLLGLLGRDPTG